MLRRIIFFVLAAFIIESFYTYSGKRDTMAIWLFRPTFVIKESRKEKKKILPQKPSLKGKTRKKK